jgi:hypothetical protein
MTIVQGLLLALFALAFLLARKGDALAVPLLVTAAGLAIEVMP